MEEDAIPERPWTVTTAFYMLWLSILWLPAIAILWNWSEVVSCWRLSQGVSSDLRVLVGLVIGLVLGLWLAVVVAVYMVGRGRNWARIFLLIFLLLGAPGQLLSTIQSSGHSAFARPLYQAFQLEIQIVVVVLLLQRSSSRWFRGYGETTQQRRGTRSDSDLNWPRERSGNLQEGSTARHPVVE
jgi:hypothetical protein